MNKKTYIEKKRYFDVDTSLTIKGIAVAMMLFHHLFRYGKDLTKYDIVYYPFPEVNIRNVATVFKICVSLFTFISGYGLYLNYRNTMLSPSRWVLQRLVKLLSSFWFVVIICWIMLSLINGYPQNLYCGEGYYKGIIYMIIEFFGCANLFGTPMLNGTWWYMSAAVVFVFLLPLVMALEDKILSLLLLVMALPRILGFGYQGGVSTYSFLFIFFLGIFFAKYNFTDKWINYKHGRFLKFLVELILIFIGYIFYRKIPMEMFWEYHFGFYPLLIILFSAEFIHCIPFMGKGLALLGKHSANVFYIHVFIYTFLGFIYRMPYFWISYVMLFGISLGASFLIEKVKEITRYEKIIAKICSKIEN